MAAHRETLAPETLRPATVPGTAQKRSELTHDQESRDLESPGPENPVLPNQRFRYRSPGQKRKGAPNCCRTPTALDQTHLAMQALDRGDRKAAMDALQQVAGKLDLVVSRDPKLALAPVDVETTILDLYATVDAVKAAVKQARQDISDNHIQDARHRIEGLASEANIHVTELPLATYPAAIKAVAPLIDAGRIDEAKAALAASLNTIVIETYAIPLPRVRAVAMLDMADTLAAKKDRKEDDNRKVRELVEAARHEIQLAEALGYGAHDDYKPLYAELDDVQRKTEGGNTGTGIFRKLSDRVKNFKFLG